MTHTSRAVPVALNLVIIEPKCREDAHTLRNADENDAHLRADLHAAIMRASPVAIAITSVDNDLIVDVNPAFERLFKVVRAEVIGQSLLAMFGPSSPLENLLTLVRSNGSVQDLEGRAQTRSGEPLALSLPAASTPKPPGRQQ